MPGALLLHTHRPRAAFVPVISHRLHSMENLLLRQGDSSISLGQCRPAAASRARISLQSRPPARAVVCAHTLTRALLFRSCAPPGAIPQKNSLTIKSSSRAWTWKPSQIIFYVYEYASGDTGTLFSREKRSWRLNLAVAADVK